MLSVHIASLFHIFPTYNVELEAVCVVRMWLRENVRRIASYV